MKFGKVANYDGVLGQIVTEDNKYMFSYVGVFEKVKNGDFVCFNVMDEKDNIAYDVKPIEMDSSLTLSKKQKEE